MVHEDYYRNFNIVSTLGDEGKHFCNACNVSLIENFQCPKCGQYWPEEETEHELKIVGIDGEEEGMLSNVEQPIISVAPETWNIPKSAIGKEDKKMAESYQRLESKGFHFTSYYDSTQQ